MRETESGLLVPDELRAHAVITNDDIRVLRRAARIAEGQELTIAIFCQKCKEPLIPGMSKQMESTLNCRCKERVVW